MLPVFMERRFLCKTVTFCFQTGYTSLVSANNEGLRAFKCVCVCVCVFALQLTCTICVSAHARASVCTCAYYSKNPRILTFILMLDQVKTQTAVNCWAKEKLKQTHRLCFSFFFFFGFPPQAHSFHYLLICSRPQSGSQHYTPTFNLGSCHREINERIKIK